MGLQDHTENAVNRSNGIEPPQDWRNRLSEGTIKHFVYQDPGERNSAGDQPRLIQGIRRRDGIGDLFIYMKVRPENEDCPPGDGMTDGPWPPAIPSPRICGCASPSGGIV